MFKYVQNRILIYLRIFLVSLDIFFVNFTYIFVFYFSIYVGWMPSIYSESSTFKTSWIIFNLIAVLMGYVSKLYKDSTLERLEDMFRSTFRAGMGLILGFALCMGGTGQMVHSWYFFALLAAVLAAYFVGSRFFMTFVYTRFPKKYNWVKPVTIIGQDSVLPPVEDYFRQHGAFFDINTITYQDRESFLSKEQTLAKFRSYFQEVTKEGIYDVFIVTTPEVSNYSKDLILEADYQCVQLNFVPAITASIVYNGHGERANLQMDLPVLKSHEEPMSSMENRFKKRIVDLMISGAVIVFVLSWLVPLIGIIIKIQSPGPIFFKQLRSGRNNKSFYCYKFRSMVVNKESGLKQAEKGDKRITPIGKFLRKSNLDEFPQFFNVFLGDMSVVGPRPHMLSHTEHYSQLIRHYMVRHFVKPGITGWAQVNGFRGETKDPELMAKRVEYDIEYLRNWSAMLDFKIVCMTAWNMIRGEKNAY